MAAGNAFSVNKPLIAQAPGKVGEAHSNIQSQLTKLWSDIEQLLNPQTFQGSTYAAYQAVQTQWNIDVKQINNALHQIQEMFQANSTNYANVDEAHRQQLTSLAGTVSQILNPPQ